MDTPNKSWGVNKKKKILLHHTGSVGEGNVAYGTGER